MLVHDMRFAPGIMSRFAAHRILSGPPPELIVARQRQGVWVQRVTHHHSALHFALRLATSVFGLLRGVRRLGSARAELNPIIAGPTDARVTIAAPFAAVVVAPLPLVLPGVLHGRHDKEGQGAVSHVDVGTAGSQMFSRQSLVAGVAPLRRVLRGSPAGESEPRPMSASVTESRRDVRADMKVRDWTSRAAEPAIDVNVLTDRVIHAIDRRIIAQRERMGRS